MATLIPFRGVLYDPRVIGDIREVVAPPYDVVDADLQTALHARHPENVIRLELGLEQPGDGGHHNRYTRAADCLQTWLTRGVLRRDRQRAIYPYTIDYRVPSGSAAGESRVVAGFLTLMELEELGQGRVLPHENTRAAAKTDRYNLLETCRANFSPIFSLFSDPDQHVHRMIEPVLRSQPPRVELKDDEGFLHRVWVVTDPSVLEALAAALKPKCLFIADGHHRYETALAFRKQQRATERPASDSLRPSDGVLMWCASLEDPGLTILPTHRVLRAALPPLDQIRARLNADFSLEEVPFRDDTEPTARAKFLRALHDARPEQPTFGLALKREPRYVLCHLRAAALPAQATARARDRLDVSILHLKILGGLGITELDEGAVLYTKAEDEALNLVREGAAEAAFLLNPTRVSEVSAVASAGERMPHKSTYFFPKPLTGLVMHVMDEGGL